MNKQEYMQQLALKIPPYFYTRPRDLKLDQARDLAVYLWAVGYFKIANKDFLREDKQGNITPPPPQTRVVINPPTIFGVDFVIIQKFSGWLKTLKVSQSASVALSNLDFRMVVFLFWFSYLMYTYNSVTRIYHLGIGAGKGPANDCHNTGRAFDFAGVAGGSGSVSPYELLVGREWFAQPVSMPVQWGGVKKGAKLAQWPEKFTQTNYRLDSTTNPYLDQSLSPVLAGQVFRFAYDVGAWGCEDKPGNGQPPSTVANSSAIKHPDHPQSEPGTGFGREAHWQHIHMQIGPTFS